MPDLKTEEPLWVQRMRARGYDVRSGTSTAPLTEEPEVTFPPPVHPILRAYGRTLRRLQKMFGVKPSTNGWNAPLS